MAIGKYIKESTKKKKKRRKRRKRRKWKKRKENKGQRKKVFFGIIASKVDLMRVHDQ